MKSFRQLIAKAAVPYWRFLVLYIIFAAGTALFDVLVNRAAGDLSNAATSMDTDALRGILVTMAWLTAVKLVCAAVNACLSGNMLGRAEYNLREGFARHYAHISFRDLTARPSGDILSLYTADLPRSAALLTGSLLDVLSGALMLVASAVFMFRIHGLYTLIFFLSYPLLTAMQVAVSAPLAPLSQEVSRRRGAFNNVVNDCLQNTSLILGYGLEEAMEQRYLAAYDAFFAAEKKDISIRTRLIIIGIAVTFLPLVFLCIAGALAVTRGTLSLGEFLALFLLGTGANEGLFMLSQNLGNIREQQACAQRVLEAMAEPHEPASAAGVARYGAGSDAITLTDVSYSYDGQTPVLKGVSLRIPRGARVAFVGKSGCGKSTLAKLMLGLYSPAAGSVRWLDSDEIEPQEARRAVAYVPQDSFLFSGTVAENLRCGAAREEGDESRLWDALDKAELKQFIAERQGGLDGVIEENGENLSGGQRQRLAIARAFFRGAPILLLDEATSALDPATERAVLERLAKTAKEQTVVMVAHRLAAVKVCDIIYMMENGQITEQGSYDELMRQGTRFFELYKRQMEEERGNA